jgi:hypothetical protein
VSSLSVDGMSTDRFNGAAGPMFHLHVSPRQATPAYRAVAGPKDSSAGLCSTREKQARISPSGFAIPPDG